jgi:hypothetical protein
MYAKKGFKGWQDFYRGALNISNRLFSIDEGNNVLVVYVTFTTRNKSLGIWKLEMFARESDGLRTYDCRDL